jgi:predicted DNA-binding protein
VERTAILSDLEYDAHMKGITIKLSEITVQRLRQEAQTTGRTVAALVRDRVEGMHRDRGDSVYALTSDLAGTVAGPRRSATNNRRRFRKS